jgi:hypothetical protein
MTLRFKHPRNGLQTHSVAQIYLRRERRGSTRNVEYQSGRFPCAEGHDAPNLFVSTAHLVLDPASFCLAVQIGIPRSNYR